MKACYPGTFDPITIGHLDIIERAAKKVDELDIYIMKNPRKKSVFSEEERKELIEKSISDLSCKDKIHVYIGNGLTVNFAKEMGAEMIVRGIRAVSDYEYELQQATANQMLNEDIETVFFIARPKYSFLSSSVVKEIALNDGDISEFVPKQIVEVVENKLKNK